MNTTKDMVENIVNHMKNRLVSNKCVFKLALQTK